MSPATKKILGQLDVPRHPRHSGGNLAHSSLLRPSEQESSRTPDNLMVRKEKTTTLFFVQEKNEIKPNRFLSRRNVKILFHLDVVAMIQGGFCCPL